MKKIFKLILQAIIFLLILELGARVAVLIKPIRREIMKDFSNEAWRWMWLERQYQQGVTIFYSFDRYDPSRGWALKPNLLNWPCFENKYLNTNSKGLRGKIEYSYGKLKDKIRLLVLGDSFTFGDEVNDNETYPFYLQQMLPHGQVINMGEHGYGHDQMLIYFKQEGVKYKPDIVILGFVNDDMNRNMLDFRDYAKPRFKLAGNQLKLYNIPVPPPDVILRQEPWKSKFIDLCRILLFNISLKDGIYEKERMTITKAILRDLVKTTKNIGAVPVFLYLDSVRENSHALSMTAAEKRFSDFCKDIPVRCVFVRQKVLLAIKSGLKIKEGGHFDSMTNQLVAAGLNEYLLKNDLLKQY